MEDVGKATYPGDATSISPAGVSQWGAVRSHYANIQERPYFSRVYIRMLSRYLKRLIPPEASILEIGCGSGELLSLLPHKKIAGLDLSPTQVELAKNRLPAGKFFMGAGETYSFKDTYDTILLSDVLNEAADVQQMLLNLQSAARPETRLVINFHNTVWRPVLGMATRFGLKPRHPKSNWLSRQDVTNLLQLAGWEVVNEDSRVLIPHPLGGVGTFINAILSPFFSWLCLVLFIVARPVTDDKRGPFGTAALSSTTYAQRRAASVSILVPARNEEGNIKEIISRIPEMGRWTEIIFIEGHSNDGTWVKIQEVIRSHPQRRISAYQQAGHGKGDAMRTGYAHASGDVFIILDADMTVPPEELPKFYEALINGKGEFINGVRLVYPLENESMRFLNMCGNKFFSILFSWLLGQPVKDTLCGTKAFAASTYHRIAHNRAYFGEFDPFGDFDLLFGAAHLNVRIVDMPVRYQKRLYGQTQIDRWRDGVYLLKMAVYAARKIKFV